eukprot:6191684-Pleurochrysis_carterae.AAC.1
MVSRLAHHGVKQAISLSERLFMVSTRSLLVEAAVGPDSYAAAAFNKLKVHSEHGTLSHFKSSFFWPAGKSNRSSRVPFGVGASYI